VKKAVAGATTDNRRVEVDNQCVIVHLVNARMKPGSVDRRLMASGTFVGLAVVGAAVLRVINGGQGVASFLASLLVAAFGIWLLFVYAWMRVRNATLYVTEDRIGITNALGIRREIPISMVDHLRISAANTKVPTPLGVLQIVAKDPTKTIRFRGGDRLEPGGIERVARAVNVALEGSWQTPI
jgi:hypothetical protein